MYVVGGNIVELRNNFNWDNNRLNNKLSRQWAKMQKTAKFKEFYHLYIQKTSDLFFEFSKQGNLIFQNKPITNTKHKYLTFFIITNPFLEI